MMSAMDRRRGGTNRDGLITAGPADLGALGALAALTEDDRLVLAVREPARAARTATLARPFGDRVWAALGVDALWTHQAAAIDAIRDGRSVVVATGTASGKSLCFRAPIAEAVVEAGATALLLYPTKALAQDQLRGFGDLDLREVVAATYDGDTGPELRAWLRREANVVLTNPEMLHGGILPNHPRWASFLRRLRYVVVDELHVLRGVFGSHVAHVLRRLRRLCARYGADPVFVFASATIGDPAGLARTLCGLDVEAITDDGSPRGERVVALWNPPLVDPDRGIRLPPGPETAGLVAALVGEGHRTVAFCRSRRATETVAADIRRRLAAAGRRDLAAGVRSYRAGYLATERRAIEADLASGAASAVVATSALELGVDIGGLDGCVVNGFPGTVASLRQQMGRAGRHGQHSVAVLVAGTDALDQWLMEHPTEVFLRPPEPAVVNLTNPSVMEPHLACAAFEAPLTPDDTRFWGTPLDETVHRLVVSDHLRVERGRAHWVGAGSPAARIGLRTGSSVEVRIVDADDDRLVGTVDGVRACEVVHPGAIYLHLGQTYRVQALDLDARVATVRATDDDEATDVRRTVAVRLLGDPDASTTIGPVSLHLGTVEVAGQVVGYERRDTRTGETFAREPLDLPPTRLVTRAFWYVIDDDVLAAAGLDRTRVPGALHAMEHTAIGLLPLFTICDRWDVGGVSTPHLADTGAATVVIHDAVPGGAGIAELGFDASRRLLAAVRARLERCRCRAGCPSCVQSPKCGNGNDPLDKAGALALVRTILA
jgi:DEAD/DEAH box helicase domain-containing protein